MTSDRENIRDAVAAEKADTAARACRGGERATGPSAVQAGAGCCG